MDYGEINPQGNVLAFVDRGNFTGNDFTQADFTVTDTYTAFSLASIVPTNTKLVLFTAHVVSTTGNKIFRLRNTDHTNNTNRTTLVAQVANVDAYADMVCSVNSSRQLDYYISAGTTWSQIELIIRGWWI